MQKLARLNDCRDFNGLKISISQSLQSPAGLTAPNLADSIASADSSQSGVRNLFIRKGAKPPLPLVAFLCLSFSTAFVRIYIMTGLFMGSLLAGRYLSRYFSLQLKPVTHAVRKHGQRLFHIERKLTHA